jgi:hypothetical protein
VEITGEISRSPLSEVLEALFRFVNVVGAEMLEGQNHVQQQLVDSPTLPEPEVGDQANFGVEDQQALQVSKGSTPLPEAPGANPNGESSPGDVFELLNRIREDLTKSKVTDVVMRPSSAENLNVVIALGLEFLSEGVLETLLSGRFTVLGKVTQDLCAFLLMPETMGPVKRAKTQGRVLAM